MVRLTNPPKDKVFFPIRQSRRTAARNTRQFRVVVGRNLENRLITFALKNGARAAFLRVVSGTTLLVVRDRKGKKIETAITGRAYEWHLALDKADGAGEDDRAGLNRYLKPSAGLTTRCYTQDRAA